MRGMAWGERKKSAIVKLNLTGLNIFNGEVPELSFRRREGPGRGVGREYGGHWSCSMREEIERGKEICGAKRGYT